MTTDPNEKFSWEIAKWHRSDGRFDLQHGYDYASEQEVIGWYDELPSASEVAERVRAIMDQPSTRRRATT